MNDFVTPRQRQEPLFSVRSALRTVVFGLLIGSLVLAQGGAVPVVLSQTEPVNGQVGVNLDSPFTIRFAGPIQPGTITPSSVAVRMGNVQLSTSLQVSTNGKVVSGVVLETDSVGTNATLDLVVLGDLILGVNGLAVDADGNGTPGGSRVIRYQVGSPPGQVLQNASATVLGRVFDAVGAPLAGAQVTSVYFPATEGSPELPVPPGVSDSQGRFQYVTVPFLGTEEFLVRVRKAGHSEVLREITVLAGSSTNLGDVFLQQIATPVPVQAQQGGTLPDPSGQATLVIPPNALQQSSNIGVTVLSSAEFLRDELPPLVATAGTFVDVAGVFGEQTLQPVTLRVPNTYNLPVGTQIPFGKVDHNTLEWSDLRQVGNATMGVVLPGGAWIEVQFDQFCSICTGYCLPYPPPNCNDGSCSDPNGDPGKGPGEDCGNSTISRREGYLREVVSLPGFREFGEDTGIALAYASYAASPSATLSSTVAYNSTRPIERTVFRFQIEGRSLDAAYAYSSNNQQPVGSWIWDGRNGLGQRLPTGSYPYSIRATSLNANAPVSIPATFGGTATQVFSNITYPGLAPLPSNTVTGRAIIVNLEDSPYGAGWSLVNEQRLSFDADGCIVLIHGNAEWKRFDPSPTNSNLWISPSQDPSILSRSPADGTFRRLFPDGALYVFSPAGRILQQVDRYGYITHFTYTANLLTRITTPTGFWFDLGYVGGKLRQVVDSTGRTTNFTVNAAGDLTTILDATGTPRNFGYDAEHLLTSQTGARGERTNYAYVNGRAVEASVYDVSNGPLLRRRTYAPSVLSGEASTAGALGQGTLANPIPLAENRVDVETDGRGGVTRHISNQDGRPIRFEDPLNRVATFNYHPNGLLASRVRPDGSSTQYTYNQNSQPTQIREVQTNGTVYSTTTMEYNAPYAEVSRVVDPEGKQTLFAYDAIGNMIAVTDHNGGMMTYTYGHPTFPNLVTTATGPTGHQVVFTYDGHGNVATQTDFPDATAFPQGRTTVFQSNAAGFIQTITNPRGHVTSFAYDAWNRMTSEVDPLFRTTLLSYSNAGCSCADDRLTMVTLPGGSTIRYEYDGLDRLVRRIDQLGVLSQYTHDGEGHVTSMTNRSGEIVRFFYDAAGQKIRKELPGGDFAFYTYNSLGNLTSAIDAGCELRFEYDFLGRQTRATTLFSFTLPGGVSVSLQDGLTSTYDRVGNRLSLQSDNGVVRNNYTYDNLHRISGLSVPGSTPSLGWTFGHDGAGLRTSLTGPSGTSSTAYSYDAAGQLTDIVHQTSPPIMLEYSDFDGSGNVLSQSMIVGPSTLLVSFQYDVLSGLAAATSSTPFGETLTQQVCIFDAASRLQSDGTYTYSYDPEGRLVVRDRIGSPLRETFGWDAEGKLRTYQEVLDGPGGSQVLTGVTYSYDPLGRRTAKSTNGVVQRFLYDHEDIVVRLDGQNRVEVRLVHGPETDEALAMIDPVAGTTSYFHTDRLGSVLATSGSGGSLGQVLVYDDFGKTVGQMTDFNLPPFGFTGREQDLETGLAHHRARFYDPEVGRFVSEDPIDLSGGLNLYAYVGGNPVNATDPTGEYAVVGGIIGGLGNLAWQLYQNGGNLDCVNFWEVGAWALSGSGLGMLGRTGLGNLGRFFYDSRRFSNISRSYWNAHGGANGMSLDHWFFSQAAGRSGAVPQGIVNGGWNQLVMPRSWNTWLGFAPRWGGNQAALANAARLGIQVGVPTAAAGAGYAGYQIGSNAQDTPCGCK